MTIQNDGLAGKRILLIDDDCSVLEVIARAFSLAGGTVYTPQNGQVGLWQFFEQEPDLVILDVLMPIMDGWETCRKLRQISTVPILMLTGVGGDPQVIRGLNEGADDYLVKPVGIDLLLARAQALLRRTALPPPSPKAFIYDDGYLRIDRSQRQVWLQGQPVALTETEYELLAYLYRHEDHWR
jgi:DNA-binding response OmpR family regulator